LEKNVGEMAEYQKWQENNLLATESITQAVRRMAAQFLIGTEPGAYSRDPGNERGEVVTLFSLRHSAIRPKAQIAPLLGASCFSPWSPWVSVPPDSRFTLSVDFPRGVMSLSPSQWLPAYNSLQNQLGSQELFNEAHSDL
jgi:hypothetical protein